MRRGLEVFDRIIVAVARDSGKNPLFTLDERVEMIREVFRGQLRVEVEAFSGLLVDYVPGTQANTILRGLRAVSDFEYEFQMAGMNRAMNDRVETVFLMADAHYQAIASRLVKEIALFGGDIAPFVSPAVCEEVVARVAERGQRGDY